MEAVDPVVVDMAAALARHLRQGRDRRLAVLDWFAEAGQHRQSGAARVPEPPVVAVRDAVVWVMRGSMSQQLLQAATRAAEAGGEEGQDAVYEVAGRMLAAHPYRGAAHPALVRSVLEADTEIPAGSPSAGFVHLVAVSCLGAEEVGAEALAEAFAAIGMFGLTVQEWADMLGAAERGESPPVNWGLLQQIVDMLGPVQRASGTQLLRARTVLTGLQSFYAMYVLHGLLLPDTPALRALRNRIDERGMFPLLDHMISISPTPQQYAEGLAACLGSAFDKLYDALTEQLTEDPLLFHIPGDETGATGFCEAWLRALQDATHPTGNVAS
ncbi:hypothetical protein ACIREE_42050 [Streptomyces sp. NPDC102467]|uniref:hypothetical protein n=1 Tax=Streptomyces sp. NPDC102467 TaxID=3366179 RepID=UPI003812CA53